MHQSNADRSAVPCAHDERELRICILNAPLDSGNLGLQALGITTLCELAARLPNAHLTILSGWPGRRHEQITVQQPWGKQTVRFEELGASLSRKPWKPGNMYVESLLRRGTLGDSAGIITRCFADAHLILDCSGGDSFTTLYGDWRYQYVTFPKFEAMEHKAPFVLMPQTYGPFSENVRGDVRMVLRRASQVWARDTHSGSIAHDHGADDVRVCPDIAFALPHACGRVGDRAVRVGVNVSGLLWAAGSAQLARRYEITCDYQALMQRIVLTFLDDPLVTVGLLPHVVLDGNNAESDIRAAHALIERLPGEVRSRVSIMPSPRDATDAKSMMSGLEFFVGTRMHSCIAALSSRIPTCAVAYSDKTRGVFQSVECGEAVLDPRTQTSEDMTQQLLACWTGRSVFVEKLACSIPAAHRRISHLFDELSQLAIVSADAISRARRAA